MRLDEVIAKVRKILNQSLQIERLIIVLLNTIENGIGEKF